MPNKKEFNHFMDPNGDLFFDDFDILVSYETSEANKKSEELKRQLHQFFEENGGKRLLNSTFLFKDKDFEKLKKFINKHIYKNISKNTEIDIIFCKITKCENNILYYK